MGTLWNGQHLSQAPNDKESCKTLPRFSGFVHPVDPSGRIFTVGRLLTLTVWVKVLSALPDGASKYGAQSVVQFKKGPNI